MTLCRILNVGPDANVACLLEGLVRSEEPVVLQHIETGILALDELTGTPEADLPSIVILSFRLPVLTGLDFIVQTRSHGHLRSLPIMVWGPDIPPNQIERMHSAGAACVFLGEFDTLHLDYVRRFLGLSYVAAEESANPPARNRFTAAARRIAFGDSTATRS
jgi:CheY-like chemotaxis protein